MRNLEDDEADVILHFRLRGADAQRLLAFEARLPQLKRALVARECLMVGLGLVEDKPAELLERRKHTA